MNIQWNIWHVISLQLQHGGMSDGGGSIWAFRCLPFFTMNAVSMPQLRWRSIWQCMNHTPATEKIHNITPNLIVILRLTVSRVFLFLFLNRGHECLQHTRVGCLESDCSPTIPRNIDGILMGRIHQIVAQRIPIFIEIPKSPSNNIETMSMEKIGRASCRERV